MTAWCGVSLRQAVAAIMAAVEVRETFAVKVITSCCLRWNHYYALFQIRYTSTFCHILHYYPLPLCMNSLCTVDQKQQRERWNGKLSEAEAGM